VVREAARLANVAAQSAACEHVAAAAALKKQVDTEDPDAAILKMASATFNDCEVYFKVAEDAAARADDAAAAAEHIAENARKMAANARQVRRSADASAAKNKYNVKDKKDNPRNDRPRSGQRRLNGAHRQAAAGRSCRSESRQERRPRFRVTKVRLTVQRSSSGVSGKLVQLLLVLLVQLAVFWRCAAADRDLIGCDCFHVCVSLSNVPPFLCVTCLVVGPEEAAVVGCLGVVAATTDLSALPASSDAGPFMTVWLNQPQFRT